MKSPLHTRIKSTDEVETWEQSPWYTRLCLEFGYSLQRVATAFPIYVSDLITIVACFATAAWLIPDAAILWGQFGPMLACEILVAIAMGLPQVIGTHPILEIRRIFLTACVALAIMSSTALYLRRPELIWGLAGGQLILILTLPCSRAVTRNLMARQSWWGVRTIVCGCGKRLSSLFRDHFVSLSNGLRVVGFYEDQLPEDCPQDLKRYYFGPNDSAHRAPRCHHAYHAVVHRFGREDHELVRFAHQYLFNFRKIDFATDSLLLPAFWTSSGEIGATLESELERPSSRILKRFIDITFSSVLLVATAPLILILGVVVKLTSRGPALSKVECVGIDGEVFHRYRLRSDSATINEIVARPGDEAARTLGAALRRYGIDQLPQLWNVLVGNMSIVGPKPLTPEEVAGFEDESFDVTPVRPGVFGIRQLLNESGQSRRIELDLFYVRKWSIWFDIYIIGLTAKRVFCAEE